MKKLLPLVLLGLFASCDFYYIEPRYDNRDRMVGSYDVHEYSETFNDHLYYSMRIAKSSYDQQEIYIYNFYDADIRVYAYVDYERITIPFQIVDGYEVEGVGTFRNGDLSLSYRVKDRYNNTRTDFCKTTAWLDY
ncbi:MAG: hypothetical protein JNM57_08720 [Cyclobacteriaceae bacterium]|nr:hypothetical protein [Cyclobacteriaceae bacterium]